MGWTSYFDPTSRRAGDRPMVHRDVTLSGASALTRGAVLGRVAAGSASSAAKSGGNTGNGTFVLNVSTPELVNVLPGVYTVRFTTTTNIRLSDPRGDVLGDYAITATTGQTATVLDQIKGVVTEGSSTFAAGDGFDITVATADKYILSVATAIDGSQVPAAILATDTDPSAGDLTAPVYFEGEFAFEQLSYDASWTSFAQLDAAFRQSGSEIFVRQLGQLG